jgi:hypothetical protein
MRYAEKEVEYLEKQAVEEAARGGRAIPPSEVTLPKFKELQAKRRAEAEHQILDERAVLEQNIVEIDKQILQIQKALLDIDGVQSIDDSSENVTAELLNSKKRSDSDVMNLDDRGAGCMGPGGVYVEYPEYDGEEEPHENKKAFTLFCKRTRREVKNALSPSLRKDKVSQSVCVWNLTRVFSLTPISLDRPYSTSGSH